MFDLDVFSVVHLSRLLVPMFEARPGGGTFVVVSSTAGKMGVPFSGTYDGAKHALHVIIGINCIIVDYPVSDQFYNHYS